MEIKFSRHAGRRIKLYGIKRNDITRIIKEGSKTKEGNKINYQLKISSIKYPIKIVAELKKDCIFIITAYPLKRGVKNEN